MEDSAHSRSRRGPNVAKARALRAADNVEPGQGGERRAEIAALACKMFRRYGYDAVGMRRIADAANLQAPSLYHHFSSKEELLLTSILSVNKDFIDAHLPALDESGSYADRLASLIRAHVTHIGMNSDAWWATMRELRALSAENLELVQSSRRYYRHRITEFVISGIAAGEFYCENVPLTVLAVLDMLNGFNEWFALDEGHTLRDMADFYARTVLRMFGAETRRQ
jgi:TetR/AcrR family transcriptional regulator, cholesterol catabolism regulator